MLLLENVENVDENVGVFRLLAVMFLDENVGVFKLLAVMFLDENEAVDEFRRPPTPFHNLHLPDDGGCSPGPQISSTESSKVSSASSASRCSMIGVSTELLTVCGDEALWVWVWRRHGKGSDFGKFVEFENENLEDGEKVCDEEQPGIITSESVEWQRVVMEVSRRSKLAGANFPGVCLEEEESRL